MSEHAPTPVTVRFRFVSPPPHVCEQGAHSLQSPTPHIGLGVGFGVGLDVGLNVGLIVGINVGLIVGLNVGLVVGLNVGLGVGRGVGHG